MFPVCVRPNAWRINTRRFRQSADPLRQNSLFSAFFTQWVCSLAATPPQVSVSPPPNGGNGVIRGTTRRRHTVSQLLMLQNPHQHRRGGRWRAWLRYPWAVEARQLDTWKAPRRDKTRPTRTAPGHCGAKLALHTPSHRMSGTKLALHTPSHRMSGTKLALLAQNGPNWHVFRAQGELYTAVASKKPRRANFIPLSPARSRAGRTLYRMRGKDGAIHNSTPGPTGVKGAGGSGGHGRASRSTTPSEARVWRSRGRPGPTAPGTPAGPQATPSMRRAAAHGAARPSRAHQAARSGRKR